MDIGDICISIRARLHSYPLFDQLFVREKGMYKGGCVRFLSWLISLNLCLSIFRDFVNYLFCLWFSFSNWIFYNFWRKVCILINRMDSFVTGYIVYIFYFRSWVLFIFLLLSANFFNLSLIDIFHVDKLINHLI